MRDCKLTPLHTTLGQVLGITDLKPKCNARSELQVIDRLLSSNYKRIDVDLAVAYQRITHIDSGYPSRVDIKLDHTTDVE
jgi:hypothetical protein